MTRKLECVKINEHGMTELVHDHLCRYAAKPLTETVCNVDKPCDRKYNTTVGWVKIILLSFPSVAPTSFS